VFVAVRGFDNNVYVNQGDLGSVYVGWQTDRVIQTNVAPAVATTPDGVLFLATDTQGRIMVNRVVLGQAGEGCTSSAAVAGPTPARRPRSPATTATTCSKRSRASMGSSISTRAASASARSAGSAS